MDISHTHTHILALVLLRLCLALMSHYCAALVVVFDGAGAVSIVRSFVRPIVRLLDVVCSSTPMHSHRLAAHQQSTASAVAQAAAAAAEAAATAATSEQ